MEFIHLEEYLLEYAVKFEEVFRNKIIDNNLHASDNLYNSFNIDVNVEEMTYRVNIDIASYHKYIESGREAGKFPPLNAIKQWITSKPIVPYANNGKVPTTDQLAFMIGRKIQREGIEPKPIMGETTDELNEEWLQGVKTALMKDVNAELIKAFKLNNKKK